MSDQGQTLIFVCTCLTRAVHHSWRALAKLLSLHKLVIARKVQTCNHNFATAVGDCVTLCCSCTVPWIRACIAVLCMVADSDTNRR